MKIIWSMEAVSDLDSIYEFYYEKSPLVAANIYNTIVDEVDILIRFPKIAAVEELLADMSQIFRSLIVLNKYKVIYRIDNQRIIIDKVWDCRQNPGNLKIK
ncbi:MAG: type II toxin-antitoxin system RelE/ParE family toxin [Bacteroidia bacterium]|nr:type II toxin-antitoxin system RelE/ParE family toxin [Bacteroidia bacterium]